MASRKKPKDHDDRKGSLGFEEKLWAAADLLRNNIDPAGSPRVRFSCQRRFRICEEKGSGIDRVVQAAEVYQLPAPDFHVGVGRTTACIYGPRPFEGMDRGDRIRATYQHSALRWVMNERMTNTTLRERFGLPESSSPTASHMITATIRAGLIKLDERSGSSRKLARYLPFWA